MRPKLIISGGQTGADRGALDAAMDLGIATAGFCPRGRRAEDGEIPAHYPMTELSSPAWMPRTRANIDAANATVILTRGRPTGGSRRTMLHCIYSQKPYLLLDLTETDDAAVAVRLRTWLQRYLIDILNVAGSRESTVPGIQARTREILRLALEVSRDDRITGR